MTIARSQQICPEITPYYHCTSRCVRQSFLCGTDWNSGRSYEHRRQWVEDRILALGQIYCIDICAYAVMHNHYHLVVHINQDKAKKLSDREVIERWGAAHHLPSLIHRYLDHQLTGVELRSCCKMIQEWRERLYSLSWLMKELNYGIARQANLEDGCSGHFWEGRFKSQALLDEKALLGAMVYNDLNPVRACISETPEDSEHTSIHKRFKALRNNQLTPSGLFPFIGNQENQAGIPFRLIDYLELVDWVGRQVRFDKRGYIDDEHPRILERLSLGRAEFLELCTSMEKHRCLWVGGHADISRVKKKLNRQRICVIYT